MVYQRVINVKEKKNKRIQKMLSERATIKIGCTIKARMRRKHLVRRQKEEEASPGSYLGE